MRRALLLLGLAASACSRSELLMVSPAPGEELLVLASLDASGGAERVVLCPFGSPGGGDCQLAATDARVQYWFLSARDYLPAEPGMSWMPTAARPASRAAPADSCGRCLAPELLDAPLLLHPGDACRIPATARTAAVGGTPDPHLGEQIRLDWAGPCPCAGALALGGSTCTHEVEQLEPPWPRPRWVEIDRGGAIAVITATVASWIDPSGARSTHPLRLPAPISQGTPRPGGGVVLETRAADETSVLHWLDRAARKVGESPLDGAIRALRHDFAPDTVFGFGSHRVATGTQPMIDLCEDSSMSCKALHPMPLLPLSKRFDDARILSDGVIVASSSGDYGGLIFFDGLPSWSEAHGAMSTDGEGPIRRGAIDGHAFISLDLSGTSTGAIEPIGKISEVIALGAVGSRIFLCGRSDSEPMVLTTTISRAALASGAFDPRRGWSITKPSPASCTHFIAAPIPGQIWLIGSGDLAEAFDADRGQSLGPAVSLAERLGLPRGLEHLRTSSSGWLAAVDHSGSVFRRPPGGDFSLVHGGRDGSYGDYRTVLALDGGFWAFGDATEVVRVEAGRVSRPSIQGLSSTDHIQAATAAEDGAIWLAGSDGQRGWLGRIPAQSTRLERVIDFQGAELNISGLVELAPGLLVASSEFAPELYLLDEHSGSISSIAMLDGPLVPACPDVPGAAGRPRTWRGLSASHGVVWAVACDGRIRCIVPTRSSAGSVSCGPPPDGSNLTAVSAFCPDHAAIARLGSKAQAVLEVAGGASQFFESSTPSYPFALVGPPEDLLLAEDDGVTSPSFDGMITFNSPFQQVLTTAGAMLPSGERLFAGTRGQLFRVTRAASGLGNACQQP